MGHNSRSNEAPIRAIRRSIVISILMPSLTIAISLALLLATYSIGYDASPFMPVVAILLFGQMAWFAFKSLDHNCPNCLYNLSLDMMKPMRTLAWATLFSDPVICPNCKFDLSATSAPVQDNSGESREIDSSTKKL